MKSMRSIHARAAAAIMLLGGVGVSACGSDDATGVNDCDIVTTVTGLRDIYVVGEVSNVSVSYRARNPSASCNDGGINKTQKSGSSDATVAAVTPAGQLIAIAPGSATITWGPETAQPFSKVITVIAFVQLKQ